MSYPKIFLKKGKELSMKRFHPWVFSGAIGRVEGTAHNGDVAEVYTQEGVYLGTGHAAEGSIAVRIFSFTGFDDSQNFWNIKIEAALQLRIKLGLIDNPSTNIYRLVHAEGDGLPGLVVDIYNTTAVIQTHSVGMHLHRNKIAIAIKEVLKDRVTAIYDKSAEKIDKKNEIVGTDGYLLGAKNDGVSLENNCRFNIDWETGQKTGFFIDQREHRALLGHYAKGKKVLNTFCYSGGFSIYALKEGATLAHSLDSSQSALDLTDRNVVLNGFDEKVHKSIKADAVEFIKNIETDYDIIVLDPPAFAKHLSARHKAVQGYLRINEAALRQIKSGGLLFTFSCSQVVDKQLFNSTIAAAAINAGRTVRILHQLHQPPDHPISIFHPEGEYLKGLVLEVL